MNNGWHNQIINHDVTKPFPLDDSCIDVCITSPPYWGLRDYGVDGQIGLESHPKEYIEHLVGVAREIRRVLKKSGSFYLNLGDTYFSTTIGTGGEETAQVGSHKAGGGAHFKPRKFKSNNTWCQPKQLMLIPMRVAIALQDDGWILRNDIIWHKPNPMPSSVKDRLNNTFEHVFHFVKSRKYYYDLDAIRVPHKEGVTRWGGNIMKPAKKTKYSKEDRKTIYCRTDEERLWRNPEGKNPGDTFEGDAVLGESGAIKVPGGKGWTKKIPGGGARCAKDPRWSPPEGKNPGDVYNLSKECGLPIQGPKARSNLPSQYQHREGNAINNNPQGKNPGDFWDICTQPFTSYNADLEHFAVFPEELIVKPIKASCPNDGVVLDPFCGRGTVGKVARDLGLNYVLFDIKPEYCEMARLYVGGQKRKLIKYQQKLNYDET